MYPSKKGVPLRFEGCPFYFLILNDNKGGYKLTKSNYKSDKRHKELKRKMKQEQKKQRRQEKNPVKLNEHLDQLQDKGENL